MKLRALLLSLVLAGWGEIVARPGSAVIKGNCNVYIPQILGNNNQVKINQDCSSLSPKLRERLERRISTLYAEQKAAHKKDFDQFKSEVEAELRRTQQRVEELQSRMGLLLGNNEELYERAKILVAQGDFEKAGKLIDAILPSLQPGTDNAAEIHYQRSILYRLVMDEDRAFHHIKKAYQYRPMNLSYRMTYAEWLLGQGRADLATPLYEAIIAELPKLSEQSDPRLALAIYDCSWLYYAKGDTQRGIKYAREAVGLFRQLVAAGRDDLKAELAVALAGLGTQYVAQYNMEMAEKAFDEVAKIYREMLVASLPIDALSFSGILSALTGFYLAAGPVSKAESSVNQGIHLLRGTENSEYAAFQWELMKMLVLKGEVLIRLGKLKSGEDALGEASQIIAELEQVAPEAVRLPKAYVHIHLGQIYIRSDRIGDSERMVLKARTLLEDGHAIETIRHRRTLATTLRLLGRFALRSEQIVEGEKLFRESIELLRLSYPLGDAKDAFLLADGLCDLGVLLSGQNRTAEGLELCLESAEIYYRLVSSATTPHELLFGRGLVISLMAAANMQLLLGKLDDYGTNRRKALRLYSALDEPSRAEFRGKLVRLMKFELKVLGKYGKTEDVERVQAEVDRLEMDGIVSN